MPELLDLLDLDGAIVTLDSMGCQRKIVERIVEKKGRLHNWSEGELRQVE